MYIVLAFTRSNPLHKAGGREPGKPAGTFGSVKGVVEVSERAEGAEGPLVMWWHEMQQTRVQPPKVDVLIMGFHILHAVPFVRGCSRLRCVFKQVTKAVIT